MFPLKLLRFNSLKKWEFGLNPPSNDPFNLYVASLSKSIPKYNTTGRHCLDNYTIYGNLLQHFVVLALFRRSHISDTLTKNQLTVCSL